MKYKTKGTIKKIIAAVLAVIMLFGTIPWFAIQALADTPFAFEASFGRGLRPAGPIYDPSPALATDPLPDGQVHLSWPIEADPGTVFRLTFPVGNTTGNSLNHLYVEITGTNTALVRYVPGSTLGAAFSVNIGVPPDASPGSVNFVSLATLESNQPTGANVPPGVFFPDRYYPQPGGFGDPANIDPGNPDFFIDSRHEYFGMTPLFGIQQNNGGGFSFRSGVPGESDYMTAAHSISFLWEGGNFHVTTGGLQQGRIYDFTLTQGSGAIYTAADPGADPNFTPVSGPPLGTQAVFTGFNYAARPIARHRAAPNPRAEDAQASPEDLLFEGRESMGLDGRGDFPIGWTNWDLISTYDPDNPLSHPSNVLIHYNPIGDPGNDFYPAGFTSDTDPPGQENMLEFTIEIPERWIGGTFAPLPLEDTGSDPVIAGARTIFGPGTSLTFGIDDGIGTNYTFIIRNIFAENYEIFRQPDNGRIFVLPAYEGSLDTSARLRTTIILDGNEPFSIPASRLFSESTLEFGGTRPEGIDLMRDGVFRLSGLHTFLSYSVVYMDGDFHVRIEPFVGRNSEGLYRIDFHTPPAPGQTGASVRSDGSDRPVFIPLILAPSAFTQFSVIFEPGGLNLYSQMMAFEATPDRMILTAPAGFNVVPNNPSLSYILDGDGLAEFEIEARWQMGMVGAMRGFFDILSPIPSDPPDPNDPTTVDEIIFTYAIRSRQDQDQPGNVADKIAEVDILFTMHRADDVPTDPETEPAFLAGDITWEIIAIRYGMGAHDCLDPILPPIPPTSPPDYIDCGCFPDVGGIIRATLVETQPINVFVPLRLIADSAEDAEEGRSPLLYEGIYFMSNVLMRVNHDGVADPGRPFAHEMFESSHNNYSYITISRPDLRDFPGPQNLEADVHEGVAGFDMTFGVPAVEIDRFLGRSPFHNAGHDHRVTYRVFLGASRHMREIVGQTPEWRTDNIGMGANDIIFPILGDDGAYGEVPPRTDWNSVPGDFNFGELPLDTPLTFDEIEIIPDMVRDEEVRRQLDERAYEAIQGALVEHIVDALEEFGTDFEYISDWLEYVAPGDEEEHDDARAAAWPVIRNGVMGRGWDEATMSAIWASQGDLDVTIAQWAAVISGFNWWPHIRRDWESVASDFDLTTLASSDRFDAITLSDARITQPILGRLDIERENFWNLISVDFRAHLAEQLDDEIIMISDWLHYITGNPVLGPVPPGLAAAREAGWALIRAGEIIEYEDWDDVMLPIWADYTELNATIAAWTALLTDFDFAPQPDTSPVLGDLIVNGDNEQGVFDLRPFIDRIRDGVVVLQIPYEASVPPADFRQMFSFVGLDYNWTYYVMVDSFIQFYDGDMPIFTEYPPHARDYSGSSGVEAFSTWIEVVPPDGGEIVPPAPRELRVEGVTLNSVTTSWLDVPRPAELEGARIEFEIVRMRNMQVSPAYLLDMRDQSVAQFRDGMTAEARAAFEAAVRTNRVPNAAGQLQLSLVNPPNFTQGAAVLNSFHLSHPGEGRVELENLGLVPNTLYFYYVRTVWITDSGYTYSNWMVVSATTQIVQPPINLRIMDGRGFPAANINPENQIVIRFDAPVGGLGAGNIAIDHGNIFDFRFSLREEAGSWGAPVPLPSVLGGGGQHRLLERRPSVGMPGYYEFTYVIGGLRPGTTYSIRVHTFDRANSGADVFAHVYSAWSNIASARTEVDQDYIDRERDRDNLRRYLRDLLMEFMRRPYWVAQDRLNTFITLYRPTMINYLINENGTMIFLADSEQDINVFYLPQALFLRIWDDGQGFIVQRGQMEISIPNQAINRVNSQPVLSAMTRIRDVRGIEDYYVRLTLDVREHPNQMIHGATPAGQQVIMSVEAVESNRNVRDLDEAILRQLQYLVETDYYLNRIVVGRSMTFAQEIDNMIARGMSYQFMVRRLHEIAEIITQEMSAYVNTRLRASAGRVTAFNYISQPVSIGLLNVNPSDMVGGFQFAGGNWARREVLTLGTTRVIRTSVPGSFGFNSQTVNLPGLSNIPGHDRLQGIIISNNLTEFLGSGATFDLNAPISLNAVQGIVARLGGATAGTNAQNWLRQRGYIVPVRGAAAPAQTQEAVYTVMALYEMRTNTRVNDLRTTNFNALAGINGIDARMRPFIQAAFELNIYNNQNMQPTGTMTTGDFLRMLIALDRRVGLQ
ncbi:MAG: hypothetical protein LBE35_08870 [Clostridiales bacterium]|jgi:hypothetical protein|nr:hypothetical protein [Clostridiales bacterium]